MILVAISIATR